MTTHYNPSPRMSFGRDRWGEGVKREAEMKARERNEQALVLEVIKPLIPPSKRLRSYE